MNTWLGSGAVQGALRRCSGLSLGSFLEIESGLISKYTVVFVWLYAHVWLCMSCITVCMYVHVQRRMPSP